MFENKIILKAIKKYIIYYDIKHWRCNCKICFCENNNFIIFAYGFQEN